MSWWRNLVSHKRFELSRKWSQYQKDWCGNILSMKWLQYQTTCTPAHHLRLKPVWRLFFLFEAWVRKLILNAMIFVRYFELCAYMHVNVLAAVLGLPCFNMWKWILCSRLHSVVVLNFIKGLWFGELRQTQRSSSIFAVAVRKQNVALGSDIEANTQGFGASGVGVDVPLQNLNLALYEFVQYSKLVIKP